MVKNLFLWSVTECQTIEELNARWDQESVESIRDASHLVIDSPQKFFYTYEEKSSLLRKAILLKSLQYIPELTRYYLDYFVNEHYDRWLIFYLPLLRSPFFVNAFDHLHSDQQTFFIGVFKGYMEQYIKKERAVSDFFDDTGYNALAAYRLLFHPDVWPVLHDVDIKEENYSALIQAKRQWDCSEGRQVLLAFSSDVTAQNEEEQSWLMQYKIMGPPSLWPHTEEQTFKEMDLHFP